MIGRIPTLNNVLFDTNIYLYHYRKYPPVVDVTEGIARKAAEIRRLWKTRTGKNLKLPDAIIAATALLHKASLIGNNDKDFAPLHDMVGLDYRNPIRSQEELRTFLSLPKFRFSSLVLSK
jgi:predicted nucleic acid-binding protein